MLNVKCGLVSSKDVARIDFVLHVIKTSIIAIGDKGMTLRLERLHIVHHLATKESCAVFKGRLIDDHLCPLCLNTLHDALNCALAEVVAVRLHR